MRPRIQICIALLCWSCIICLAAGCSDTRPTHEGKGTAAAESQNPEPTERTGVDAGITGGSQADDSLPGMLCMVNQNGIRRKVLIAKHGVLGTTSPGGAPAGADPLPYFRVFFLHDVYPASARENIEQASHYRIGRSPRHEALVWIPASAGCLWDHRILLAPDNDLNIRRPPLSVYSSPAVLEELLRSGRASGQPIARYTWKAGVTSKFMPWPILETRQIEDSEGNVTEIDKIAFLAEFREGADISLDGPFQEGQGGGDAYTAQEVSDIKQKVTMLDVVFVVDNTLSTTPYVESIRRTVNDIAGRLAHITRTTDLNLGLVLYRDYVKGLMFEDSDGQAVTKTYPLVSDLQTFQVQIASLKAPEKDSEDYAEAVYDGVMAGLNTVWRPTNLATRCIMLMGDNSAHEPTNPKNPDKISAQNLMSSAKEKGVHIFALCINGGGGAQEQTLHWNQCNALAEGTGGQCFRFDDSLENVMAGIERVLKAEVSLIETRKAAVHALSEGKRDEEIVRDMGVDPHEFTEIMEFLRGAGVDPEKIRRGGVTFSTGWVVPVWRGVPICDKKVHIARSELRLLIATLQELCVYCDSDFGRHVMTGLLGSAADGLATAFMNSGQDAGPFDLYLIRKGIPLRTGLLSLTQDELTHMPEEDRSALRRQIESHYLPQLLNALNDDRNFQFGGLWEFGLISAQALP